MESIIIDGSFRSVNNTGRRDFFEVVDRNGHLYINTGFCICCDNIIWTMKYLYNPVLKVQFNGSKPFNKSICKKCHHKLYYKRKHFLL